MPGPSQQQVSCRARPSRPSRAVSHSPREPPGGRCRDHRSRTSGGWARWEELCVAWLNRCYWRRTTCTEGLPRPGCSPFTWCRARKCDPRDVGFLRRLLGTALGGDAFYFFWGERQRRIGASQLRQTYDLGRRREPCSTQPLWRRFSTCCVGPQLIKEQLEVYVAPRNDSRVWSKSETGGGASASTIKFLSRILHAGHLRSVRSQIQDACFALSHRAIF